MQECKMAVELPSFPDPFSEVQKLLLLQFILNACPVCSLWFSSYDYAALGCGHTYHPYCLFEHSQGSSTCLLKTCGKPFDKETIEGIGIRLAVEAPSNARKKAEGLQKDAAVSVSLPNSSAATTAESSRPQAVATNSSSLELEGPEKAMPLSQSSETNRTLNEPSTAGLADGTTRSSCLAWMHPQSVLLWLHRETTTLPGMRRINHRLEPHSKQAVCESTDWITCYMPHL